jgi:uncharacterized membrane protein
VATYQRSLAVDAEPGAVFAYLSDVGNLPDYFSRMLSAEPAGGEAVRTQAVLPDGQHVGGEAWFRVDQAAQRIEWGSEGPSGYHGWLAVSGSGPTTVEVHISTARVASEGIEGDLDRTLANVKRLVEGGPGPGV